MQLLIEKSMEAFARIYRGFPVRSVLCNVRCSVARIPRTETAVEWPGGSARVH